ncbi:MAG: GNAT family N-acetyltransferase [Eubacteriales bacterium]|nr:GNAT family N-acetyltransferase [Eubacteriales bacterium]
MEFPEKKILLRDGRTAILRSAQPGDAAEMAAFMKTTAGETEFLLRYPEECTMDAAGEAVFIDDVLNSAEQVMPCCFVEGKLAGNAMLTMNSRIKTRHRGSVAIGLLREYWGLGIGTALFQELIAIAETCGLGILELDYIEGNDRARRLYEKMGFIEAARVPDAYRLKDGSSRGSILMMKKL